MPRKTRKKKTVGLFGPPTLDNLLDWSVTLCLSALIVLTTLRLGGVQPATQVELMPLFAVLLGLHGFWAAVQKRTEFRLSAVPFFFLPFMAWACLSVLYFTPVAWRGEYELIQIVGGFIFFWVAVNNLRTRAHLWAVVFSALTPAGFALYRAFYQFFQDRSYLADGGGGIAVKLHPDFLGQATGVFADPHSFAAYALLMLPAFMVTAFVPRFPPILRIFCFYMGVIIVGAMSFAQVYWAILMLALLVISVPFFCFRKGRMRLTVAVLGLLLCVSLFSGMYWVSPLFKGGFHRALTPEGEGVRLQLWQEAVAAVLDKPVTGQGAGAYSLFLEQSGTGALPVVAATPHNDFLLILSQYGFVGALFAFVPLGFVVLRAFRVWQAEGFARRVKGSGQSAKMPAQKFFLSIGLSGLLGCAAAASFAFLLYIPALLLLGLLLFSICVKGSFGREIALPQVPLAGWLYGVGAALAGVLFVVYAAPKLESRALEQWASEELSYLVSQKIPIAGDPRRLDAVVHRFEEALRFDPKNVDAWIGLSSAILQTHFRNPADFEQTADRALAAAGRARELCPDYWLVHAQVGIAEALRGDAVAAETALFIAVSIAPNSSNANYYYAAFLGLSRETQSRATEYVERALEIDPQNEVARRLQRRLSIL